MNDQMEQSPQIVAANPSRKTDVDEQQVHVLLVKKDPDEVRAMLEAAEKPLGVHFRLTWIDGLESYPDRASPDAFDVILLDLEQPGEDGFQAVHRACFLAPGLPIVVLADVDQKRNVPRGVRNEVQDILVRDQLTGILLANSLHHVCERSRLQHALGSLPRDCRTGLFNRNFFMVMAEQYMRLAGRLHGLVAVYAVLDGIHRINPPLYHLEERRMLLNTARALVKTFRGSDLAAHWGRFEFVALAIGAATEHVPLIVNRLNHHLNTFNAGIEPRQRIHLSAGFAAYDGKEERTIGDLVCAADAARRNASPAKAG